MWFLVKAVGLTLRFSDTLVLLGAASLSTLVPSGPAFLGTLQFAYALAVEFAGGARALGIAAATLAQLCLLLPLALIAAGILVHRSGNALYTILAQGGNLMLGEPANDAPRGNERDFVRRGGGKVLKSCPCR